MTEPWHLKREIPIALILAIVIQTVGMIWWAAQLDGRVTAVEGWVNENRRVEARLAVLESQLGDIKALLQRVESRLDGRADQRR